ncbi:uncharacterized protein LOC119791806 [Cyprinodon tularosa]|uniref:uncharacterized protein LOC119791806 n=1 Tax=Cyprinodon tularosa TaxID=77115 RepID=UPI0018E1E71B|nr:uncharacterized protein LOC119791806 [Cyprinodon tularosa]
MNEKSDYQPRVFSKPPGYVGPPSYSRPHKSPPVTQNCDIGWQHVGNNQANWSQPIYGKQDVPVDLQTKRHVEKDLSNACPELKQQRSSKHKGDASKADRPTDAQKPEELLAKQTQAANVSNKEKEDICKVIEGRKFRLKKKTGGMTIFCLVSRIVSPSETKSLPVCPSQTSPQVTETGALSKDTQDNKQVKELVDDVDSRAQASEEQSDKKTLGFGKKMIPEEDPSSTAKGVLEKPVFERSESLSVQPLLTKYPLWREPSSSNKTDTESSNKTCLKDTKGSMLNQDGGEDLRSHSADDEEKNLQIKDNAEDMKGLFVIDTSCVVVKVEMIPSPKKEQVHYLGSTANDESCSKLYQDVTTRPSEEALRRNEDPEADLDSTPMNKLEYKETDVPQLTSLSEKETLAERAERILGIPLHDADIKQKSEDYEPLCEEEEEAEPHPAEDMLEDVAEQVEVPRVEKDGDEIGNQLTNDGGKDFTDVQNLATQDDDTESLLKTDDTLTQTELKKDDRDESTCGESKKEEHNVDLYSSSSVPQNLLDPGIQDGSALDLTPHPDTPSPPLFPKTPDSFLSSFPSEDHLPSPPRLEEIFLADDEELYVETKDDEMLHLAESELNKSLVTEIEGVLPHEDNNCQQWDDVPCISEKQETDEGDCSTDETRYEDPDILAQLLTCVQIEGATSAKGEQDHQLEESILPDPSVQMGQKENARSCKTEEVGFDVEGGVFREKERGETLEQSQINPGPIASLSEQRQSSERNKSTQTQPQADTLQNVDPQREFIDNCPPSPSSSEVLHNHLIADDLPGRDHVPLLETVSPLNIVTAAPDKENSSDPFYIQSFEESSQLTIVPPHEDDVSPEFSPTAAHKTGSQYSKSLLEVVNRIRKHTAPDSESEEEEVSERSDASCLDMVADLESEENFDELLKDSAETRQGDQDHKESEEHADEDAMSCSSTSHVLENTVTVVDIETRPSSEVEEKKEESDTAEGEVRCSSNEKGESQFKGSKDEDLTIGGSSEHIPVEVDVDATEVLTH